MCVWGEGGRGCLDFLVACATQAVMDEGNLLTPSPTSSLSGAGAKPTKESNQPPLHLHR